MIHGGYVYLVGAGPWDPGLLTLRGRELLSRADSVVYDYLVNPELLEHVHPQAHRLPVGPKDNRLSQDEINTLLVERAQMGEMVVRLKGGDPFVFGRGGEEADVLAAAGIPFQVVPGVTAAIASASFAGIPVTHRGYGSTLAFVTGHERADKAESNVDWSALAGISTVVFYMGARRLRRIAEQLIAAGKPGTTPVALIRWASRPAQKTVVSTLAECAVGAESTQVKPPLTIVVGEVVSLRERLGWFERLPLHGMRVVVTRSKAQRRALTDRLSDLGAEVIALPTIAVELADQEPVKAAIIELASYDWVLFTSGNAVDAFLDSVYAMGLDPRAFGGARIACIGPATARRLEARGLRSDLVPTEYVAEGLLDALLAKGIDGARILLPRAEIARELLPDRLRAAGADLHVLPVYRTVQSTPNDEVRDRVARGEVDVLTFTASSTVTHFCGLFSTAEFALIRERIQVVCIGPITAQTAVDLGLDVVAIAEPYTVDGLVDALIRWHSLL